MVDASWNQNISLALRINPWIKVIPTAKIDYSEGFTHG
tara:strand:+ start:341 stop:454 length:114 start_codon:yes stop_codon:yes gene_type:complete